MFHCDEVEDPFVDQFGVASDLRVSFRASKTGLAPTVALITKTRLFKYIVTSKKKRKKKKKKKAAIPNYIFQ